LRPNTRWGADERWIYSGYTSDRLEVGIGLSANESASRPHSPPIIWTYLRNLELPASESAARAADACRRVAGATQAWSGYPSVAQTATEVLIGPDFRAQTREVVHFAFVVLREFQAVGYLAPDLPITEPGLLHEPHPMNE